MGKCIITTPPPITYSYVDLGLPNGTKWATQNVGARKPSDYGLYFAWGDTQGYSADQVGTGEGQKKFSEDYSDYKWYLSGTIDDDNLKFKKYTIPGTALDLEDDAAHVNMGGDWHMPTPTQINELINNTTNTWTTQDNVKGRLFTSKNNGKSIFIPAAGSAWNGSVSDSGYLGRVWSSMLYTDDAGFCQELRFASGYAVLGADDRSQGFSIRGVVG